MDTERTTTYLVIDQFGRVLSVRDETSQLAPALRVTVKHDLEERGRFTGELYQ
jgi:hypothetical protein